VPALELVQGSHLVFEGPPQAGVYYVVTNAGGTVVAYGTATGAVVAGAVVLGISLPFMFIDLLGGAFSILSLVFKCHLDVLAVERFPLAAFDFPAVLAQSFEIVAGEFFGFRR